MESTVDEKRPTPASVTEEPTAEKKRPKPVPVPEALKVIPVSREAFYRKLKSRELPCYKFGAKVLVDIDEVLAAMRMKHQ